MQVTSLAISIAAVTISIVTLVITADKINQVKVILKRYINHKHYVVMGTTTIGEEVDYDSRGDK